MICMLPEAFFSVRVFLAYPRSKANRAQPSFRTFVSELEFLRARKALPLFRFRKFEETCLQCGLNALKAKL